MIIYTYIDKLGPWASQTGAQPGASPGRSPGGNPVESPVASPVGRVASPVGRVDGGPAFGGPSVCVCIYIYIYILYICVYNYMYWLDHLCFSDPLVCEMNSYPKKNRDDIP